jgi:uncharacterized protein
MRHEVYEVNDDGSITLAVHAQPGAGRSQVTGRHGDAVKIRVAAPPEGGRANDALVKLLAELLGVSARDVTLVSGESSRTKRFRVTGIDHDEIPKAIDRLLSPGDVPSSSAGWRERRRSV